MLERVFTANERRIVSADQLGPLTELAEAVRELTEAVIFSDVDPAEVSSVQAEVAALTERLRAVRREGTPVADGDVHIMQRVLANPVSGVLNPIAPPVTLQFLPDRTVRCEYTLSAVYEGPPGFVHGGISALVLDQLLGAAAAANGTPGMTASLEMRYRRPTPYGVPLVAEARAGRTEGRRTWVHATITRPDGKVTIEATGVFMEPLRPLTETPSVQQSG